MAFFLSVKEIWHSKGRYLLISLIVALITTLVLFIAGLGEGLGSGNREYLEKLNGELVAFQENVDLSVGASRLGRSKVNEIRRLAGVEDVGQIAYASASVVVEGEDLPIDISLFGVEPGHPGEPPALQGRALARSRANEVVIDGRLVEQTGLGVGDILTIRSIKGTEEEFFDLEIVGTTDGRAYFIAPGVFVPYLTWEKVRPGDSDQSRAGDFISNLIAIKLVDSTSWKDTAQAIMKAVDGIEVVDRVTAYEAAPGYAAQQSTLDTQKYFAFFIGLLVIGGFFQIQTLQKVAQIGMLKAVGVSTWTVAFSAIVQIILVNALGVLIGAIGSWALSLTFPVTVPIIFTPESLLSTVVALMLIGPLGGVVSVWALLRVDPLTALRLAQ